MNSFHFCAQHQTTSGAILYFDGILTPKQGCVTGDNYASIKADIAKQMSATFDIEISGPRITILSLTKL